MKDISGEIEYRGKKYRLIFNLNVMEEIQEKYGSIEKWGSECDPKDGAPNDGEPNIKALKFGFAAMLNEGLEITNEENGTNEKPLTLRQVGRIISEIGTENAVMALNSTVIKSTQSDQKNS